MKKQTKLLSLLLSVLLICSCFSVLSAIPAAATEKTYTVVGAPADIFAASWDATYELNDMELTEGSLWTITYCEVEPQNGIQFKIVGDHDWSECYGTDNGDNVEFNVTETCDVTITFDSETHEINVYGDGVVIPDSIVVNTVTAVGNGQGGFLNDIGWDTAAPENEMTEVEDGHYRITYEEVDEGDNYQVKFVLNGEDSSWSYNFGAFSNAEFQNGEWCDANYNGENIYFDVFEDGSTVTLDLDLSDFDYQTKTGAKYMITVTDDADIDGSYTVAGSSNEIFGIAWDAANTDNDMELTNGSLWSITYPDVQPEDGILFKIVANHSWEESYGLTGGYTFEFNVTETCDVTITFDSETHEINVYGDGVIIPDSIDVNTVSAAGNGEGNFLNGSAWDALYVENEMTEVEDGHYRITYEDVDAYECEVKFVLNAEESFWRYNFGAPEGAEFQNGEWCDAEYDGENIAFDVVDDGATVTLDLDLSDFDYQTRTGAKYMITITYPDYEEEICYVAVKTFEHGQGGWDYQNEYVLSDEDNEIASFTFENVPPVDIAGIQVMERHFKRYSNGKLRLDYETVLGKVYYAVSAECDVTVSYNEDTQELTVSGENVTVLDSVPDNLPVTLNRSDGTVVNMEKNSDGVYVYTDSELEAGSYSYQFRAMDGMLNWGPEDNIFTFGEPTAAGFGENGGDFYVNPHKSGYSFTFTLDLTSFSFATGEGAVCCLSTDMPEQEPFEVSGLISLNESVTARVNGDIVYYKFVPKESGNVWFWSLSENDTYGYIYDNNGYQISSDDDSGNNSNFKVGAYVEKGRTYYVGCRFYGWGTGSFPIIITDEEVDFDGPRVEGSSTALFGESGTINPKMYMTDKGNDKYEKVIKNAAPEDNVSVWLNFGGSENYYGVLGIPVRFNITETCDLTIGYDYSTGALTVSGDAVEMVSSTEDIDNVVICGEGQDYWVNNEWWNPNSEANRLTATDDSVYEITYRHVRQGRNVFHISLKTAQNRDITLGVNPGSGYDLGETAELTVNGDNIGFDAGYRYSDVTVRVDFSEMNVASGEGIKLTVTAVPSETPFPLEGEIAVGESVVATSDGRFYTSYYKFVPENDGEIYVTSSARSLYRGYTLYDENGDYITDSYGSYDPTLSTNVNAGQTYYLGVYVSANKGSQLRVYLTDQYPDNKEMFMIPVVIGTNTETFGTAMDSYNLSNEMVKGDDGIWTKVYKAVPACEYEQLAVVYGETYGYRRNQNLYYRVSEPCDMTVTFDPQTFAVTVTGDHVTVNRTLSPSAVSIYPTDNEYERFEGLSDDFTAPENAMTKAEDGVFTRTFTGLHNGWYYFKLVADNNSFLTFGTYQDIHYMGVNNNLTLENDGMACVYLENDGCTVTLTADFRDFDFKDNCNVDLRIAVTDGDGVPVSNNATNYDEVKHQVAQVIYKTYETATVAQLTALLNANTVTVHDAIKRIYDDRNDFDKFWAISEKLSQCTDASEKLRVLLGDVNLDGIIDIRDATEIQRYIAKFGELSEEALAAADLNLDGSVNIDDAMLLQFYCAHIEHENNFCGRISENGELLGETYTVYYKGSVSDENINVYAWNSSGKALMEMPGVKMERLNAKVFKAEIPVDAEKVMFLNGFDLIGEASVADNMIFDRGIWRIPTETELTKAEEGSDLYGIFLDVATNGIYDEESYWCVWTWGASGEGSWVVSDGGDNDAIHFSNVDDYFVLYRMSNESAEPDWGYCSDHSDLITAEYGNTFIMDGWTYGHWDN